jgi:diguanylate cyclase (GGDEF)-like protein
VAGREVTEVAREDLPSRTRQTLIDLADLLDEPKRRSVVLTGWVVLALALHLFTQDTHFAWLSAPAALFAGIAGGVRIAVTVALVAAVGHATIDLVADPRLAELPGLLLRSIVLVATGLVGAAGAYTERRGSDALQRVLNEDPVTGLLNVRAFYDGLAELRRGDQPFAILLADIRGMRALNERYGHPTGTEAMRALAHVLRRSAGPEVLASRLGSDEVAIALVGSDRDRCRALVSDIIARLHEERVSLPDGDRFEVHAAYGVARYPEDGDDEVAVLRSADRAKERAKAAGIDRVGTADGDVY